MTREKNCIYCLYAWADGTGYSDYTWMDTQVRCFLGLTTFAENDMPEKGKNWLPGDFAKGCTSYTYSHSNLPTISPEGNVTDGGERIGDLIRKLSK